MPTHLGQGRVVIKLRFLLYIHLGNLRWIRVHLVLDQESAKRLGRKESDDGTKRNGEEADDNGDTPIAAMELGDGECSTSNFHNEDLAADHCVESAQSPNAAPDTSHGTTSG